MFGFFEGLSTAWKCAIVVAVVLFAIVAVLFVIAIGIGVCYA